MPANGAHQPLSLQKKDNTVRWVSNLRDLNKVVFHKQYPLPIINDILCKYTLALDEESKDLTTIIMPFCKYCYNVLSMGLKCLPNFVQKTMENIFHDINDAEVYIEDIGAFLQDWEHNLKLLHTILTKVQENGFTVNPLKCD